MGTLLGRHIPRIAQKVDAKMYLVLERNLEIFRLSLFTVDYTLLAKKGVVFSVMDNYLEEENRIMKFLNTSVFDNYILKLTTTGINIDEDTKRYYPYNNFASQIIGFCGSDNQGLDGIEAKYDQELKGKQGSIQRHADAKGRRDWA